MSAGQWPRGVAAITLFTRDLAESKAFYEAVFAAKPVHEDPDSAVFAAGATMINLLRHQAVPELIEPATMSAAGPTAVYTIEVDDVDQTCARLMAMGLTLLNGPVDRPWGIRTASFQDPSGHIWEIS